MTISRVQSFAFAGIEAVPVEVQVQISSGLPAFLVVGLPDKAVGEARERVRAALTAMGLALPPKRVLINLAPADLLKEGSHFDLPIALAVLAAMEVLPREDMAEFAALGELSLDGSLNPVAGVLPAAIGASARGLGLICPAAQGGEAAWAGQIQVLAPADLLGLINHFRGTQVLTPPEPAGFAEAGRVPDLAEVRGMELARRGVEIAAAGGHNILLVGSPGAGKSMLAARLPGLLPDLTPAEALEVSMIHSVAGLLDGGRLVMRPPFREPHHTASQAALTGGGQRAKPGEASLAHRGVLFLDELAEFSRQSLELAAPADGKRAHDRLPRQCAHHLSLALPAGGGDESVPVRLFRRRGTRLRAGAALRGGIPEPAERAAAGPYRPDDRSAADVGCGAVARAAGGSERCGGRARCGCAPVAGGACRRGRPGDQCRSGRACAGPAARCAGAGRAGGRATAPFPAGVHADAAGGAEHRRPGGRGGGPAARCGGGACLPPPDAGAQGVACHRQNRKHAAVRLVAQPDRASFPAFSASLPDAFTLHG